MELTEKQKQILIVGLLFCGVLLVFTLYFQFMFFAKDMKEANKQAKKLSGDRDKLTKQIDTMTRFIENDEERQALRERVEVAKKRLPSDPESLQFLELLQDCLSKTGVSFTQIAQERAVNRSMYQEIPYAIQGSARYHEFGEFVNLIECHPERFMRISEFSLKNNNNRPTIHPMTVRISTFMFKGN